MSENGGKIRVDPQALTLGEYAELEETLDQPLEEMLTGRGKWRAVAGMVWILQRRTDPDFTLEDALALPFSAFELVTPDVPNPLGNGGGPPPQSLELGPSTLTGS